MIIDGKKISQEIKDELKIEVEKLRTKGIIPGLAVILIGDDPASQVYVKNKEKACEQIGIKSSAYKLPETTDEKELLKLINKLNQDKQVHGILVQFPLPKHINKKKVIMAIDSKKDIDGFHPENFGRMAVGYNSFPPCTAAGVLELLKRYNIRIEGSNAVVIGKSNIAGKPIAIMLLNAHATVSVCHTLTKDLGGFTKQADILVVAAGEPGLIKANMIKPGAVIIDVGINRLDDGRIVGDVDFEACREIASAITPVPGGVGPMTIAMLMKNCVKAASLKI
jgi:methylenetetrahydrofolate dehydrogenase (NADP+)/methenyltetrahydrofolate cyclohydrolase